MVCCGSGHSEGLSLVGSVMSALEKIREDVERCFWSLPSFWYSKKSLDLCQPGAWGFEVLKTAAGLGPRASGPSPISPCVGIAVGAKGKPLYRILSHPFRRSEEFHSSPNPSKPSRNLGSNWAGWAKQTHCIDVTGPAGLVWRNLVIQRGKHETWWFKVWIFDTHIPLCLFNVAIEHCHVENVNRHR